MKLRIVKEKSCKICCSNVKYLNRHLKLQHSNFDEKQYYDTFLKKHNEEFCKTCGTSVFSAFEDLLSVKTDFTSSEVK